MPRIVRHFAVTTPVTTPVTAPHKVALSLPPGTVRTITVRVPPGPRGVMGFAIGNAGQPVIPLPPTPWIVTDDVELTFTPTGYATSGTWWLLGYNTGTYPHTVELTFELTPPGTTTGPAAARTAAVGALPPVGTTGPVPATVGTVGPVTLPATTPVSLPAPPPTAVPPVLPVAPVTPGLPAPVIPPVTPVLPPTLVPAAGTVAPPALPTTPATAQPSGPPRLAAPTNPQEDTPMSVAIASTGTIVVERVATTGHLIVFRSGPGIGASGRWTYFDVTDILNNEGGHPPGVQA